MTSRAELSVEAGHFYKKDLVPDLLSQYYGHIALSSCLARPISTVGEDSATNRSVAVMLDDYHQIPGKNLPPSQVIGMVVDAAKENGVRIDYIAREAACVPLAPALEDLLRESPLFKVEKGKRGDDISHWLVADHPNLRPSTAMDASPSQTLLPRTMGERIASSVRVDVELWSQPGPQNNKKSWACPLLAAVWQLVRSGRLELLGGSAVMDDPTGFNHPMLVERGDLPDWEWRDMPALIQLHEDATPFPAKHIASILPVDFLGVESAVDIIIRNAGVDMQIERHFY